MKEGIKLSIIIPCYNVKTYLARCLGTIVGQTREDTEIICIDDGSDDGTLSEIKSFEGVRSVRTSHRGVSATRNLGLAIAKGEYVWFVDADDEILPGAIESIRKRAEEEDAVYFCAEIKNHCESVPVLEDIVLPDESVEKDVFCRMLCSYNSPYVWNGVFRREFLLKNGIIFPQGLSVGEDMSFQMQVFRKAKKIDLCSKPIYRYHYLEREGIMKNLVGTKERTLWHVRIAEDIFKRVEYRSLSKQEKNALSEWAFNFLADGLKYADTIRLMHPLWKKYRIRADETPEKTIKSLILRSHCLSEWYIFLKGKK